MDEKDPELQSFFISYATEDRDWAEWIAVELEAAGYLTRYQTADIRPGKDFVHEMQKGVISTSRVIAVLTPAYLESQFGAAEWRVAFAQDPSGELGLLIPVRVRDCEPPGLLMTRVYVDLVGSDEAAARKKLLAAVDKERPRPVSAAFPGARVRPSSPRDVHFPGASSAASNDSKIIEQMGQQLLAHPADGLDSRSRPRMIRPLPGFVPPHVTGREKVVGELRAVLERPGAVLTALVGGAGVGKTAAVAKFARERGSNCAIDYLAAGGYPPLNAVTVLEGLASAHSDLRIRAALLNRISDRDLSVLAKLDTVLSALGGQRVLIILDDLEHLLDDDGKLRDETLLALLDDLSGRDKHAVQVLLVTTQRPRSPVVTSVGMLDGLPPEELREFLSGLASATGKSLLPMSSRQWGLFTSLTRTWPRPAERIHGMAAGRPAALQTLLDTMTSGRTLGELTVAALGDIELDVAQAFAIYNRPVSAEAIMALVREATRNRIAEAVTSLIGRRIVRAAGKRFEEDEERFSLLPAERAEFLTADAEVRTTLQRRAAHYFYRCAHEFEAAAGLGGLIDLEPYLNSIELYLDCGDGERALRIMKEVDHRYLKGWGQTWVLAVYLTRLSSITTDTNALVLVDSLLGRALMQQGKLHEAVEHVLRAGRRNAELRDNENQVILLNQLGVSYLAQGWVGAALDAFDESVEIANSGRELWSRADARYNQAVCLIELGRLDAATRSVACARQDLGGLVGGELTSSTDDADNGRLAARLLFAEAKIALERGEYVTSIMLAERASEEAHSNGAKILAGTCDDLRAWAYLLDGDDASAIVAAKTAHRLAAETSHPNLLRITGTTLAVLHLRRVDLENAHAAADLAVRSGHGMPGAGAYALRGIVEWRRRRRRPAEDDFARGLAILRRVPNSEPKLYDSLDFSALQLAGMALIRHSTSDEASALAAYQSAIEIAGFAGVQARRRILFRELVADDHDGLASLRELLRVRATPLPEP
ncbi:toll/interleukin-1 receptor domain-containing protein [Micromonospora sp. NPDC005172]|uniref:toll/interleukin-1 receptor domain-containing protein n=1 Tax=Micromonospora sp. NPDC005172 TaxID=3156867 RepID=UPI0033BF238C